MYFWALALWQYRMCTSGHFPNCLLSACVSPLHSHLLWQGALLGVSSLPFPCKRKFIMAPRWRKYERGRVTYPPLPASSRGFLSLNAPHHFPVTLQPSSSTSAVRIVPLTLRVSSLLWKGDVSSTSFNHLSGVTCQMTKSFISQTLVIKGVLLILSWDDNRYKAESF